jgi:hypothetical protein
MAFFNGIKELAYGLRVGFRLTVLDRHSMIERTVFPRVDKIGRS